MTESIFSAKCIPQEDCYTKSVFILYLILVLIYGIGVLISQVVKKNILCIGIFFRKIKKKYFNCMKTYDHSKLQRIPSRQGEELGRRNYKCKNKNKIEKVYGIEINLHRKDITLQRNTGDQVSKHATKHTSAKADDHNKGKCGFIQWKGSKQQRESSADTELEPGAKLSNEDQIISDDNGAKESGDIGTKYLQILFYYVQDAVLFKVKLPTDNVSKTESFIVKILQFSPEVFAVYTNYSDICFTYGGSAVSKISMKSVFGPCVMLFLLLVYLIFKLASKWNSCCLSFCHFVHSYLIQTFLLVFLISYQQIITGAFTLVQCVSVEEKSVLYVQGDIICYTLWQICIKVFILLNIFPLLLILSHLPFHIKDKTISTKCFILSCVCPVPVLMYVLYLWISKRKHVTKSYIKSNANDKTNPENESLYEDSISHMLLEHYRCLTMFGIRFTWLGVHKLYRLMLVVCKTYILEPIVKLTVMSCILMLITILNVFLKPYKDCKANKTATLSYMANICIAMINIWKTGLVTFDCKTNCSLRTTMLWYFQLCESILLIWLPLVAITTWMLISTVSKCRSKFKKTR